MNKNNLLALIVWAIDRDLLSIPFKRAFELFRKDAIGCRSNYIDPTDELLYIKGLENVDSIEFFTDYILCMAKMWVNSGIRSYGKHDAEIIKYNHKKLVA